MMYRPLRSVRMKRFIFGFQRRVWWPKWTPDSSISFMVTTGMPTSSWFFRAHGDSHRRARPRLSRTGRVTGSPWCPGVAAQRPDRREAGTDRGWPPTFPRGGRRRAREVSPNFGLRGLAYLVQEERRARAAASARLRTPSLARMFETWTLTVFSLM